MSVCVVSVCVCGERVCVCGERACVCVFMKHYYPECV